MIRAARARLGASLLALVLTAGVAAGVAIQLQAEGRLGARQDARDDLRRLAEVEQAWLHAEMDELASQVQQLGRAADDDPTLDDLEPISAPSAGGLPTERPLEAAAPAPAPASEASELAPVSTAAGGFWAAAGHALAARRALREIAWVHAGQSGLVGRSLGRDADTIPRPLSSEAMKALWYADFVRAAVREGHDRIGIGAPGRAGQARRDARIWMAVARVQDDPLERAALVVEIDLAPLLETLRALSPPGTMPLLLSPGGAPLEPTGRMDARAIDRAERDSALVEALAAEGALVPRDADDRPLTALQAGGEAFLVDGGRAVYGRVLSLYDAGAKSPTGALRFAGPERFVVLGLERADAAPSWADWLRSPLPGVLLVLVYVGTALWLHGFRSPRRADVAAPEGREVELRPSETAPVPAAIESLELSPRTFALRPFLSDVLQCLQEAAETRGMDVELRYDHGLPEEIVADPDWLGPLLVQLGQAAIELEDGQAVIEVRREVRASGEALRIELHSLGTGTDAPHTRPGAAHVIGLMGGRASCSDEGRLRISLPYRGAVLH